jgi:hypothetical protein
MTYLFGILGTEAKNGATAFSITTLSIMTLSITTLSITTLSIRGLFVTLSINDIQHKRHSA